MGVLENKTRARLFYRYLSTVYDRINPFIWNERMRDDAMAMLDIARDMEDVCPDALLLNYTNPMAIVCKAVDEATDE